MTCWYKKKDGVTCNAQTPAGKRKCPDHAKATCSACGAGAWVDCPECGLPHCRKHAKVCTGSSSPDTVAKDALLCPGCECEAVHVREVKGDIAERNQVQAYCQGCGCAGPVARTVAMATTRWNSLPRGRPSVYESIRRRALAIIDEGLGVYEAALEEQTLTTADCNTVAKMLEAATMAVDTWEM